MCVFTDPVHDGEVLRLRVHCQPVHKHVSNAPKETYRQTTQLGVTFASGYLAGVVCAVVLHPADTIVTVSLMGKPENWGKCLRAIASETGIVALATKGLGTRVLMIGTLTGFQWWIYDSFKTAMGLGTTGGKCRHRRRRVNSGMWSS